MLWVARLDDEEVGLIADLLFEEPDGVVWVGDSFRHESGCADDLAARMGRGDRSH